MAHHSPTSHTHAAVGSISFYTAHLAFAQPTSGSFGRRFRSFVTVRGTGSPLPPFSSCAFWCLVGAALLGVEASLFVFHMPLTLWFLGYPQVWVGDLVVGGVGIYGLGHERFRRFHRFGVLPDGGLGGV